MIVAADGSSEACSRRDRRPGCRCGRNRPPRHGRRRPSPIAMVTAAPATGLRRLRQRDQRSAVAVLRRCSVAIGRDPEMQIRFAGRDHAAPHRSARDRIPESRAQNRCAAGNPVIQVEASALPQPLSLAGRCRVDARDLSVEIGDQPLQHLQRQRVGGMAGKQEDRKACRGERARESVEIRHRRRTCRPAHCARSAASVPPSPALPQESRVALRRRQSAARRPAVADQEEFARVAAPSRSGTVPASSATKP